MHHEEGDLVSVKSATAAKTAEGDRGDPRTPAPTPSTEFKRLLERSRQPHAIVPKTFIELRAMAEWLCQTGFVPDAFRGKPDDTAGAIAYGLEVGLSPLQSVQSIAMINGRPSLWGDAVLGLVRQSGLMEFIDERDPNDCLEKNEGRCTVQRRGELKPRTMTFTTEQAEAAGLIKRSGATGPWSTYRGRMLQMRARSWILRDVFGDVLKGLRIAEEERDRASEDNVELAQTQARAAAIATEFDIPPGDVLATMSRMGYDIDKTRAYYKNGQKATPAERPADEADTGPMTTAAAMALEQAEPAGVREHTMEPEPGQPPQDYPKTGQPPAAPATEADAATEDAAHQGFLDI